MKKCACFCLVLVMFSSGLHADEAIRSTQEELRRRNIFFGDIDGRHSPELAEALRRYQSRKGLAASGQEDRETLRSLGLAAREQGELLPKNIEWPEEPVLKSDAKLNVAAAAQVVADNTGVSVLSLLPEPDGIATRSRQRPARRSPAGGTVHSSNATIKPVAFSLVPGSNLEKELTRFIRTYLSAVGRNQLKDELEFYGDTVSYLGNGLVDRRIIEQTLRSYYQRWPSRSYTPTGVIGYRTLGERGEIEVTYRTHFSLRGRAGRARGETINRIVINAATVNPRIVSISEQRVRL